MTIEPASPPDLPAIRWLLESNGLPSDDLTEELLRHFLVLREERQALGVIGLELHGDVALLRCIAAPLMLYFAIMFLVSFLIAQRLGASKALHV